MERAHVRESHVQQTDWYESFRLVEGVSITACDIDGICERHGKYLVLESKHPNEPLGKGQEILLKQLSRLDNFTVFIVEMEDKTRGIVGRFRMVKSGVVCPPYEGHDHWCDVVRRWWNKVN